MKPKQPKPVKIHNVIAFVKDSLNTSEQELLIYAIRHINQNEDSFIESKFHLSDFANYANLELTILYREIDGMTKSLIKTVMHINTSDKNWSKINLTRKCEYKKGFVTFIFNDDIKELL